MRSVHAQQIVQVGEGNDKHDAPNKEFSVQDASFLARGMAKSVPEEDDNLSARRATTNGSSHRARD